MEGNLAGEDLTGEDSLWSNSYTIESNIYRCRQIASWALHRSVGDCYMHSDDPLLSNILTLEAKALRLKHLGELSK